MMTEQPVQQEQHLFTEAELFQYKEATLWQRFFNYVIDSLFMNYGMGFATGYILTEFIFAIDPDLAYTIFSESGSWNIIFSTYMISIFTYLIYYTFCEKLFKGHTIGKLITGTRAIRTDGGELTFKDAILRSLSRMVPFEAFSALGGYPWHDRWTNTMVIKTR